ncbi:hypothetical protein [Microbispora sp. NBC_01389]|uniref:hypothetical protein n=1 Tax=Microbispora sp. NBC_01389 TaxID=2903584 RepID=UPI003254B838
MRSPAFVIMLLMVHAASLGSSLIILVGSPLGAVGWTAVGLFAVSGLALVVALQHIVRQLPLGLVRLQEAVNSLANGESLLKATYYKADRAEDVERLHRDAGEVIRMAPRGAHIYAVNSYVEVFKASNEPRWAHIQRAYLSEFERRFGEVTYHRIIQSDGNGDRSPGHLAEQLAPAYLHHYRSIARHSSKWGAQRLRVAEVRATLPTSFVLVKHEDGGSIIWQIHKHAPRLRDEDAVQIMGIFIITDPEGIFVRHFMSWFRDMDHQQLRTLTESDLQPPDVVTASD